MDQTESNVTAARWIDTHCHLDLIKTSLEDTIYLSKTFNTVAVVTIGTTHDSNVWINEISDKNPEVYGTLGYHPHNADQFEPEHLKYIQKALEKNGKIIGIGECGFDYHYNYSTAENQKKVFEIFLDFALNTSYPLVVHSREAEEDTIKSMEPYLKKGLVAVLHSFTSTDTLADFGINYNCYFSFNGISTYKKSEQIRDVFLKVPLDRILLETDSPYLSPIPYRGKPNIPGYVSCTGQYLAELKQIEPEKFSSIVNDNAKAFYKNFNPVMNL